MGLLDEISKTKNSSRKKLPVDASPPSQPLAADEPVDTLTDDRCRCVRWREVILIPWLPEMDWALSEKFWQCAACGRLRPRE